VEALGNYYMKKFILQSVILFSFFLPFLSYAQTASFCNSGTYAGNGSTNRPIAHGLGVVPDSVVLTSYDGAGFDANSLILGTSPTLVQNGTSYSKDTVTSMDSTNFYIGGSNLYSNNSGRSVHWYACGTETLSSAGAVWGSITGTLSDQTDLNSALLNRPIPTELVWLIEFMCMFAIFGGVLYSVIFFIKKLI
jgi:hypothetical protein